MTRGLVLPLTQEQVAARARYLAGLAIASALDPYVRAPAMHCVEGYYQLKDHNGGKDPTAADPFDRWPFQAKDGSWLTAITADCIGGAAWCGGFDRFQPIRFSHIYGGWVNTDSMLMDARGPAKCFVEVDRPEVGCFVVCKSGSRGHVVGHIGTIVSVPAEWTRKERECWKAIGVVDVASTGSGNRANTLRTGVGWYDTNAGFIKSVMQP